MKIRYQNGAVLEAVILHRTENTLRIALRGSDDITELTRVRGTWVSDDCEPVSVEAALVNPTVLDYSDENFICPPELAEALIAPLFTDVIEEILEDQSLVNSMSTGISTLLA